MQIKINHHSLAIIKANTTGLTSQHIQSYLQEPRSHKFSFVFSDFLQVLNIITLIINDIAF